MHKYIYSLAALLALTIPACADVYPGNYSVSVNGANSGNQGRTAQYTFASVAGVGVVPFIAVLNPATVSITFGTQIYGPPSPSMTVDTVEFIGNRVADYISAVALEPSSTISGIVASTHVTPQINGMSGIAVYPYTYIDFDLSRATYTAGSTATFDLIFPSAQTPEPTSIIFAVTGMLFVVLLLRRDLTLAASGIRASGNG